MKFEVIQVQETGEEVVVYSGGIESCREWSDANSDQHPEAEFYVLQCESRGISMKTKELSEVEKTVESFVTGDCAVTYSVTYTGAQTREGWDCDSWRFTIKAQSFEYFTGMAHREDVTADTRKRAAFEFPGLTEKDAAGQTLYGRRYLQRVQALREPQIPPIGGLLYALVLDGGACSESFESWCMELGYDSDSRKALATYMACQENSDKLRKVFSQAQIAHIQELLQEY